MAKRKTGAAAPGYNWGRSKLITQAGVLAKRANQRLRELENQKVEGSSNAYRFVESAVKVGKYWATVGTEKKSKGKIKFNTNFRSMTDEDIQKELKLIKQFLKAPTSHTKGVRKKVEKLTDKFNEHTGLDYSTNEFEELMREDRVKELFKMFSASSLMELFGEDEERTLHAEQILAALEQDKQKSIAEMDFLTIQNAFKDWKPSVNDEQAVTPESMEEIASFGLPEKRKKK